MDEKRRRATGQVVLAHSGKQHAYWTALGLQEAGLLNRFLTSTYYKPSRYPDRVAKWLPRADEWLKRRHLSGLDEDRVLRFPLLELPEVLYRSVFRDGVNVQRLVALRDRRFDALVSRRLGALRPAVFWTYEGSANQSLSVARRLGARTVLEFADIPTAAALRYLPAQKAAASRTGRLDSIPDADVYVAASTFSARCLESLGADPRRIRVVPLGADIARFTYRRRQVPGTLRLLFVGKLSEKKGIHYLLEAMRQLRGLDVRLSVAGPDVGQQELLRSYEGLFQRLGTLHGNALVEAMHAHDILVVPSLYEGFGLVIVEAMASGMPVIATVNSCAPDVIRDGVDGFVVPIADHDTISERLEWCWHNREVLPQMGYAASERASRFSWESHAERVGAVARELAHEPDGS